MLRNKVMEKPEKEVLKTVSSSNAFEEEIFGTAEISKLLLLPSTGKTRFGPGRYFLNNVFGFDCLSFLFNATAACQLRDWLGLLH